MNAIGRNDLCPCGSNRKYKNCCLGRSGAGGPEAAGPAPRQDTAALFQAALAHQNAGRLQEAAALYQQIIAIEPRSPDALHSLGLIFSAWGDGATALQLIGQAIELAPAASLYYCNVGPMLLAAGQPDLALDCYRKAIELQRESCETFKKQAGKLQRQGRYKEAAAQNALAGAVRHEQAITFYNMGNLHKEVGRLEEALVSFRQALQYETSIPEFHNNLGTILASIDIGRNEEADASFRKAIALRPDYAAAHANLGGNLCYLNRLEEAVAELREALRLDPMRAEVHSSLLFTMSYDYHVTPSDLYEESRRFAERFEKPHMAHWPRHENSCASGRRLKIGYVSGDFRKHAVAYFIEQVLANHDKSAYEIYCYYNFYSHDNVTLRLQGYADHWVPCKSMDDEQMMDRILSDGIDILVDLSGHTAENRLPVFARKPAPVQVTWMGYCGTTGLSAMDYRFTDEYQDPVGETEGNYTEKLVYLPPGLVMFQSDPDAPEVNPLPALSKGGFTFACLNNPAKLNEYVVALWSRILAAIPDACLILGNARDVHKAWLIRQFAAHGIDDGRLLLQPRLGILEYLKLHQQIDLALDPFPYNGGTTSLHALWMGVPVLALEGKVSASRVGAGIMKGFGLPQFVAASEDAYFERAVYWAHNLAELAEVRNGLRSRIASNTSLSVESYARSVEAAYRSMWQQWCEQREGRHE